MERTRLQALSRALTRCISVVPGLAKQTAAPASAKAETRACAPVTLAAIDRRHFTRNYELCARFRALSSMSIGPTEQNLVPVLRNFS